MEPKTESRSAICEMETLTYTELIHDVLSFVASVPSGRVVTYGQIAWAVGRPKNARLVGRVLSRAEWYGDFPCHRVVNHAGRTAPGWPEQRSLLEAEGVAFLPNGNVDLKRFLWRREEGSVFN